MEPELEVPKNTEWQKQISHKRVPNANLHLQIIESISPQSTCREFIRTVGYFFL